MNKDVIEKIVFFTEGNINYASSRIYGYDLNNYFKKNFKKEFCIYNLAPTTNIQWRNKFLILRVFFKIFDFFYSLIFYFITSLIFKNKIIILHVGPLMPLFIFNLFKRNNIFIYHMIDNQLVKQLHGIENKFEFQSIFHKIYKIFGDLLFEKRSKVIFICRNSSAVLVNNDFNFKNCLELNSNTFLFTDPINFDRYTLKKYSKSTDKIVIGWIGQPTNSNYILSILEPINKLIEKYKDKISFNFIGGSDELKNYFKCEIIPWSIKTENEKLEKFDIGIMPLPLDDFTKGKGGYKILQYMAKGIPVVASPIEINNIFVKKNINGFLPENKEEWVIYMSRLIENIELRKLMGYNSRVICNKYSYEHFSKSFLDLVTRISKNEKRN